MKRVVAFLFAGVLLAASPVSYSEIRIAERSIDERIDGFSVADPIYRLGVTHGVYIEGTGAVLTAEVDLVQGPVLSPFKPNVSKEEIAKLHERKKARIPDLHKLMRDSLVSSATFLKTMPGQEQVVFGVALSYYPWEDVTGLPKQILMQARKQALLDFERGTLKTLDGAVKVQEF